MSQKREFIDDVVRDLYSMSELCERYGISRKTGYKWLDRYGAGGFDALPDRSRRPHHCPHAMSEEMSKLLLAARRAHPSWGARKLLSNLASKPKHQGLAWPAASTVTELLKRNGLVQARRRRAHPPGHPGRPTTPMDRANAVWTTDFKGEFRLTSGRYCYPLTVVDGYSRYLLGCKGLDSTASAPARKVFERLFRAHGLPERVRSDNGGPFASTGLARPLETQRLVDQARDHTRADRAQQPASERQPRTDAQDPQGRGHPASFAEPASTATTL